MSMKRLDRAWYTVANMNRRHKVSALVLSRRNIGEADRLVTLFTREHGLWKVVAKGVRRVPSRRGGHMEPFTRVLAIVSGSKAGRYLVAIETLERYQSLVNRSDTFAQAQALALIVTGLFDEEQSHPELYDALAEAWKILPDLSSSKQALLEGAIALHALRLAGMMPTLQQCQACGQRTPNEAVVLEAGRGGWRCLLCHTGFAGTSNSLSSRLLPVLRFLAASPQQALRVRLTPEEGRQLLQTIRTYIAHVMDRPLPALALNPHEYLSYGAA